MSGRERLEASAARLQRWLFDKALPLWWERGADRVSGGFFDRLDLTGAPVGGATRLRVQARQAHVYALAAQMGWSGDAEAASRHGLAAVRAARRYDGLYRMAPYPETLDGMGLVYDQAFVLLALATHHAAFGGDPALEVEASALADRLADFAHPLGGYREVPGLAAPLFANPNMHLFEAFQAWARTSSDPRWSELADGGGRLCLDHLMFANSLVEVYDAEWKTPPGAVLWPGHLFEWAFLLLDWDRSWARPAARRLVEKADAGVDPRRRVAIFAHDTQLRPLDDGARLWAQTERARACVRLAAVTGQEDLWRMAADAAETVEAFVHVPTAGLWRDWMDEAGAFREEPAPASSLYHIVGAIAELVRHAPDGR